MSYISTHVLAHHFNVFLSKVNCCAVLCGKRSPPRLTDNNYTIMILWTNNISIRALGVLKGLFTQKNTILSSFTHPPVVPDLYECPVRKVFWRMWETEQVWGTIDFYSGVFSYYESQCCPKICLVTNFFKISSFVFGRTKKWIQVWNYLRVSKL